MSVDYIFKLDIPSKLVENKEEILKKFKKYNWYPAELFPSINEWSINRYSWPLHERVISNFSSTNYPEVLFVLYIWGEEPEDYIVKYFLNGKVQIEKVKMSIPDFSLNKLKDLN